MLPPTELSFEEILKFMLAHNGKVTNHELVKHFKIFLMNPDMRDEARSTFKKHVNTLAIIKNQNNEKWLILKKKYIPSNGKENDDVSEIKVPDSPIVNVPETPSESEANITEVPPERPPLPLQLNQDFSILTNLIQDCAIPIDNVETPASVSTESPSAPSETTEDVPPKVHPRRRSSDKSNEKRSSIAESQGHRSSIPDQDVSELSETTSPTLTSSRSESMLIDTEQTISVKERKQMFNRMASESDVLKSKLGSNFGSQGVDEEDRVSLDQKSESDPLDSKQKQWILCSARGDYHALAKMCKENAKLVKTKDPFTYTAMHWACKRGDENLVKLLGGVARHIVNERSGYTPLHIAMQFRHEHVYRLLVQVYGGDPNVRDWSGRKPSQYLVHMDTSLSPGSYRKADSHDLRRTVTSPPVIKLTPNAINVHQSKKEGFLRIGSLNVRVKKTTEAFSNFLGVGATRSSAYVPKTAREERRSENGDQLHKSWGSADNIQKEDKLMPPPNNNNKVRRRGASGRRGLGAAHSRSTPSTPDQPRAQIGVCEEGDSDSDSAAGFHSAWKQQRASHCT